MAGSVGAIAGGCVPGEGMGDFVPGWSRSSRSGGELVKGAAHAAFDEPRPEVRAPSLDQVEAGCVGGGAVEHEARVAQQPAADLAVPCARRRCLRSRGPPGPARPGGLQVEETAQGQRPVLGGQLADYVAGGDVRRAEQSSCHAGGDRSCPARALPRFLGSHRAGRPGPGCPVSHPRTRPSAFAGWASFVPTTSRSCQSAAGPGRPRTSRPATAASRTPTAGAGHTTGRLSCSDEMPPQATPRSPVPSSLIVAVHGE